jgi:hypothetical protein
MSETVTQLKHITTCTICGQRFSNSALPTIGDTPNASAARFVKSLFQHIQKAHPEAIREIGKRAMILQQQFLGWLTLQGFQTTDPELIRSQEKLRQWLHEVSMKNRLNDADLTDIVVKAEPLTQESVMAACQEIRDYLSERGKYASEQEASN